MFGNVIEPKEAKNICCNNVNVIEPQEAKNIYCKNVNVTELIEIEMIRGVNRPILPKIWVLPTLTFLGHPYTISPSP